MLQSALVRHPALNRDGTRRRRSGQFDQGARDLVDSAAGPKIANRQTLLKTDSPLIQPNARHGCGSRSDQLVGTR
jgi:hypothetical protein